MLHIGLTAVLAVHASPEETFIYAEGMGRWNLLNRTRRASCFAGQNSAVRTPNDRRE